MCVLTRLVLYEVKYGETLHCHFAPLARRPQKLSMPHRNPQTQATTVSHKTRRVKPIEGRLRYAIVILTAAVGSAMTPPNIVMVLGAENTPRDNTPLRVAGAATLLTADAVTATLFDSSASPSLTDEAAG